jgi:hypothetical protein
MKKVTDEIISLIRELEKTNSDFWVAKELNKLWYPIKKNTVRNYTTRWREIEFICKKCWKKFKDKNIRKYCYDCSPCKTEQLDKFKQELKQILKETCRLTNLPESKVKKLLMEYTHTEIRRIYN